MIVFFFLYFRPVPSDYFVFETEIMHRHFKSWGRFMNDIEYSCHISIIYHLPNSWMNIKSKCHGHIRFQDSHCSLYWSRYNKFGYIATFSLYVFCFYQELQKINESCYLYVQCMLCVCFVHLYTWQYLWLVNNRGQSLSSLYLFFSV